jgi:hypothetical protein
MTSVPGVRFGIANGLLVLTLLAAAVLRVDPTAMAWVAVIAAGLVGAGLPRLMTAGLGVIAWAMYTGFVENRFGELTFADHDVRRLVVFAILTLALSAFARQVHRRGHHRLEEHSHG